LLSEELWRDLLDNPENWWDNRTDKVCLKGRKHISILFFMVRSVQNIEVSCSDMQPTPKYPDFKHKDSGKALWIGTRSPQWAVDALPHLKFNGGSKGARKKETLLS